VLYFRWAGGSCIRREVAQNLGVEAPFLRAQYESTDGEEN